MLNSHHVEVKEVTKENLIAFEKHIAELYEKGLVKGPVHLSGGNEDQLIEIFKKIDKKKDYVLSTWRNHYHWLLFGLGWQSLTGHIMSGKSMTPSNPFRRFYASAIVGGISPIALGLAMGLKLKQKPGHVWCFLGDAGFECGITKESIRYAKGHDLPITFVLEDNGKCVRADTQEIWGDQDWVDDKVFKYSYERQWPHAGTGKYVMF